MKRLAFLAVPLFSLLLLTGCLDGIASSILYPLSTANTDKIPDEPPAPFQKFTVNGTDGHQTYGWYAESTTSKAPVIIYFHGNGTNIMGEYNGAWVKDFLNISNLNILIFDYPQYGLSTGELDEKGLVQSGQDAVDFAKSKFPNSPIYFFAHSLGCAPAVEVGYLNQDSVKKVILTAAWDEFWRLIQNKSGLDESTSKSAAEGNQWLSDVYAQSYHIPVLFFHGTKDQTIPFELGQHLAQSFPQDLVTFEVVDGAGHDDLLGDKQWQEILQFIQK
jgi:pimeloyl-ACP methyl ester carboxylesterase